jgi:hypothetical protein
MFQLMSNVAGREFCCQLFRQAVDNRSVLEIVTKKSMTKKPQRNLSNSNEWRRPPPLALGATGIKGARILI